MADREFVRTERTEKLIEDFSDYLGAFERQTPFTRAGQWEHHVRTIEMRRAHGSAADAIAAPEFIDALRATLAAWGIGIRGSKLADRERFADELGKRAESLRALEGVPIITADSVHREAVWELVLSLDVVDNEARIVALTKTLHHLLPDLVIPIDRAYTGALLGWHIPEFQNRQQEIFESGWQLASAVARAVDLEQYVGSGPWHTSVTKVIDNAVVGYCIAEGLVTPARGGKKRPPPVDRTAVPRGDAWTLAELELELEAFGIELEDVGLRENTINTYVGRADTFLRWLAGTYEPRGPQS